MPTFPIPLVGPTYESRSLPVANQVTRGFYIEYGNEANEIASFQSFPGLKSFATAGTLANRGALDKSKDGKGYFVNGTLLYSIDSDATVTSIGTIPGMGRCHLSTDGANIVVCTGEGRPYIYDGMTLTQGTDLDLPFANTGTYINRRIVYDGTGDDIVFADLSDPSAVDSSYIAKAESNPDDTTAVHTFKQQIFVFGEESIEPWYFTDSGRPPYSPIQNSISQVGTTAPSSISSNKNYLYFLGSDLNVYRLSGLEPQSVSNPSIGNDFASYSTVTDAIGQCITLRGQNFYYLTFPTGNKSWLFSEDTGAWVNLASGVDGDAHYMNSYMKVGAKDLVTDRRNGNIYELDFDTYTDNGDLIQRMRDTVEISGKSLRVPDRELFMSRLEVVLESGTSLVNSDDARIVMQYSDDSGNTWSPDRPMTIGAQGEYLTKVEWFGLGSFYKRMFRFWTTDAVKFTLLSAAADIEASNG
jgi:hypothetical protein